MIRIVSGGKTLTIGANANIRATFGPNCILASQTSESIVELGDDGRPLEPLHADDVYEVQPLPSLSHAAPESCIPQMSPIGILESCFNKKNGTPRQGSICPNSRAKLRLTCGNTPEHFLQGMGDFSHVWILFLFHDNHNKTIDKLNRPALKALVKPPRLDGEKRGVFATRTPHRPNPIGLSLCKIEAVAGDTIFFSGIDIIDGTPVLDIKPYIPAYDFVDQESVKIAFWIQEAPVSCLDVSFTPEAEAQIEELIPSLTFYDDLPTFKEAVRQVLHQDPRSVYRRNKCPDELYGFGIDSVNLICKFIAHTPDKVGAGETAESRTQKWKEVVVVSVEHRSEMETRERERDGAAAAAADPGR